MARFKLLNIIPIIYFILSCGVSVWIGFELYYTINPGNVVVDVDPDGRDESKKIVAIEPKPQGSIKEIPPLKQPSSVITSPPEGKVQPIKQHLEPKRVTDDHTDTLKKKIIDPTEVVGRDHTHKKETEPDPSPENLKVKEKPDQQHMLKQKNDLKEVPKSDGEGNGIFATLYYGLSNKLAKTKKKVEKPPPPKPEHKDSSPDLHEKRATVDESDEDYKVKIFTNLYYGLSNKLPDTRKKDKKFEKPPKLHEPGGQYKKEEPVEVKPKKVVPVPKIQERTVVRSPPDEEGKDTPPGKGSKEEFKKNLEHDSPRDKANIQRGGNKIDDVEEEFFT